MCTIPPEPATNETFLRASEKTLFRHNLGSQVTGRPIIMERLTATGKVEMPEGVDPALISRLAQWSHFNVLAIAIDSLSPGTSASDEPHATLERLLTDIQSTHNALWFSWRTTLYGCIIPEVSAEAALEMARSLQLDLSTTRPETISIGVAVFPLTSFNRTQTLTNACKALEHAAFFGPNSAVVFDAISLNISGDQHYQAGNMAAAIDEYRAALRLDPRNVNVHNSLGVCLARNSDHSAARECFQTALAINPFENMALFNLGMLKQLENEAEEAIAFYKSAHKLDPHSFEINLQSGTLLVELHRYQEARSFLEAAVELQAHSGRAHCWLGQCLAGLNQNSEAIQALSRAAKLNPNDAAALSALGMLYADKGENPDICITFCRQSVLLAPRNGLFRHRLGCLYKQFDELDNALAEFESAAALGYDSTPQIDEIRQLIPTAAVNNFEPDRRLIAS
jgi:tetratricopeptide (TPR) repeat protein